MPLSSEMRSIFSKKAIIASLVVVGMAGGAWFFITRGEAEPLYDTAIVTKRDLTEEVSVTGQVQATEEVELAFESSGKVVTVNADVGDLVSVGQIIASLDSSELAAQLASARANVASAESVLREYELALRAEQAKLTELQSGTRPEELAVADTTLANAEQALVDASKAYEAVLAQNTQALNALYAQVSDILYDAQSKADDAVQKHTDALFSKEYANKNQLIFIVQNQGNKAAVEEARGDAQAAAQNFARDLLALSTNSTAYDEAMAQALVYLDTVQQFLLLLNVAINDATSLTAEQTADYRSQVSTARNELIAATTAINTHVQAIASQRANNDQEQTSAQHTINDAQRAVSLAQKELALKQSGTIPEQISQQQARVEQAESVLLTQQARVQQALADVQALNAKLGNFLILAPIRGVVTVQNVKRGQIVSANEPLVTLISEAAYEVEAFVPEADIAKIELNDIARITLDAYSNELDFVATVSKIDPGQTTVGGVVTYKVTLQFVKEDERVRTGMTANIELETDFRDQVLTVPARAIISRNGGTKRVQVLTGEDVSEVVVVTGLASSDGFVEIVSGLQEGQTVVTSVRSR